MRVSLLKRTAGHHDTVGAIKMDSVPRQGESCLIDDKFYVVHEVIWNLTENSVQLLLRDI